MLGSMPDRLRLPAGVVSKTLPAFSVLCLRRILPPLCFSRPKGHNRVESGGGTIGIPLVTPLALEIARFGSEGAEGSLADFRMDGAVVFDGLPERIGLASRSLRIDHQKYQLGLNDWLIINRAAPSALDEVARRRFVRAKAAE
jgi:hypothetical protein